jgi:phosphoribosylaminoimidazolecarboxamide formyltransferase/IMP cyclohydrolase
MPEYIQLNLKQVQLNRYGENPHQQGGLYSYGDDNPPFEVLHGKEMSYNNWLDLDGSWQSAMDFPKPTVCHHQAWQSLRPGQSADTLAAAYEKALASDPVSAFGSIVSVNRPLDVELAAEDGRSLRRSRGSALLRGRGVGLLRKRKNLRIVQPTGVPLRTLSLRSIYGGVLVQELDRSKDDMDPKNWRIVSQRQPTPEQLADLAFAWRVARNVKSNAIVYVKDEATVGVGAGQMSRVDSVMLAAHKAGDRSRGAVMASDAFFPFPDGIEEAAKYGIVAVVQPGGSIRDEKVIETVDDLGLIMAFTGTRHFRH